MTVVSHPLGVPLEAEQRGGDCRARDLSQGRNVHGPHRFAAPNYCRINNGLLRLTVGVSGVAPYLNVEGYRGAVTVNDTYGDIYGDVYGGAISTPEWLALGTVTIDSPSAAAVLTAVRIVRVNAEALTIRLVAAAIADAFVTLRRGERMARIQHGSTRAPKVDTDRRVRWTAAPSPVGTATLGRVEEVSPTHDGFPRFVAAIDPVNANAGAFSLTALSTISARFGAGVATHSFRDGAASTHLRLGDASRPTVVVT